jgi:hypothetical protein
MLLACVLCGCGRSNDGADANVTTRGAFEVTARLVEVPEGTIIRRELYDYAAVLKYEVLQVHRGKISEKVIYVGHYNPLKARSEVADRKVKEIGGTLTRFVAGDVHRLALEAPMDDHYMGALANPYFQNDVGTVYWAVWTNAVSP